MLAPESTAMTAEVPVSLDIRDRAVEKGISARRVIMKQTGAALDIVRENAPEKIVTLGGRMFRQCRAVYVSGGEISG